MPVIPVTTFVHGQVYAVEAAERHGIKIDWNERNWTERIDFPSLLLFLHDFCGGELESDYNQEIRIYPAK